jgi:hypothetical protein
LILSKPGVIVFNMKTRFLFALALIWGGICLTGHAVLAQGLSGGQVWTYQLVEGSTLVDDCPICDRPTLVQPLRGAFVLVLKEANPLFTLYELRDLALAVGAGAEAPYRVTGQGAYQIRGEVALMQEMRLDTQVNHQAKVFTNEVGTVSRSWPILEIDLVQTEASMTQVYHLHLLAAPARTIWFSTAHGMHPGTLSSATDYVSDGDLISLDGHVIKRNAELTLNLGIMPMVPDLGLAAVDLGASGEILFALNQSVFSETLGQLQQGDLLSDRGYIVKSNQALTRELGMMPPVPDLGLDALHVQGDGEILFSVKTGAFSERLGSMLGHGDVLSNRGRIARSNRQLLARFQPSEIDRDYGLDALYIWPNGEIWFSIVGGFQDKQLGAIRSGDLLSDQGYVVFRNLELVAAFQPLEDLADFGLDALFVVSDVMPPGPAPRLVDIALDQKTGDVTIRWDGSGRAFQLERADDVQGPYVAVSPILPGFEATEKAALRLRPNTFYRVRQW